MTDEKRKSFKQNLAETCIVVLENPERREKVSNFAVHILELCEQEELTFSEIDVLVSFLEGTLKAAIKEHLEEANFRTYSKIL